MAGAPRLNWGPKRLQDIFNALAEYVESITPIAGENTYVSDSASGKGKAIHSTGSGAPKTASLKIDFTLSDAGSGNLGVTNGTVDGNLPTGMTSGGTPAFTTAVTGSGYAYLIINYSISGSGTYSVTSVSIATASSVPSQTTSAAYFSLGDFNVTGSGSTAKIAIGSGAGGSGSKMSQYCGGQVLIGSI